jgi:hypothetical protein
VRKHGPFLRDADHRLTDEKTRSAVCGGSKYRISGNFTSVVHRNGAPRALPGAPCASPRKRATSLIRFIHGPWPWSSRLKDKWKRGRLVLTLVGASRDGFLMGRGWNPDALHRDGTPSTLSRLNRQRLTYLPCYLAFSYTCAALDY